MYQTIVGLLSLVAGTFVLTGSALAAEPASSPPPSSKHLVAAGESLSSIATDSNLPSWRPLWDANPQLGNPDQVNPGDELVVPAGAVPERPLPAGYGEPVAVQVAPQSYAHGSTAPRASSPALSGDLFARIRARESGGNYATNTGNGYYGAYQYNDGTWGGYGGYQHASDAPPAVQDAKAHETYAARGCNPWPNTCS